MYEIVRLHVDAPTKPPEGAPCNGCGVCCASEPCPAGVLVSRRRHGACDALLWRADAKRYRCGLVDAPAAHLPPRLRRWAPLLARVAQRYIAAGIGCDCSDTVVRPAKPAA